MLDEDFLKKFGLNLKLCRLKANMTQAMLGELVNISEHRLSQIESGRCNITLKTVNRLSNTLNISSNKLFNFDD